MSDKATLRNTMRQMRKNLNANEKKQYDERICTHLYEIISVENLHTIHSYIPMGDEVNIGPLIDTLLKEGKTIVTPKALPKRQMENRMFTDWNELENGMYGTQHPAVAQVHDGPYDLFIIPGLAFDEQKNRLGYGSGYYDNFLSKHQQGIKCGIAYPFQMLKQVPIEEHDIPLDLIIC